MKTLFLSITALATGAMMANGQALSMSEYSCAENSDFCCFEESKWEKANGKRFRCEKDANGEYPCAVRLGKNSWVGSSMNVHLAAIFIEEFLGYPVQIFDEIENADPSDPSNGQWPHMEAGIIDAILEVWPSGHSENFYKYVIEKSAVVDGGSLGVAGNIGWFMPTKTLSHQDLTPNIEYWRTFQDPQYVQAFKNPKSDIPCCTSDVYSMDNAKLPCMPTESLQGTPVSAGGLAETSECDNNPETLIPTYGGRFLAGAADWSQVDDQLIRNLGFNMTVEYAATEDNLISEFVKAVDSDQPFVFYFWKPHALFRLYNLTRVMLPPHSSECWEKGATGGVDCDYPNESLYKVYSKSFADDKPDAALFLSAFRYTSTDQQEELLADNYMNPSDSHREVACRWAKKHSNTWEQWTAAVTKQFQDKIWQRETLPLNYTTCGCDLSGERALFEYHAQSKYQIDGLVGFDVPSEESICALEKDKSVYMTRWTKVEYPVRKVNLKIACAYIPSGSPSSSVILAITIVGNIILASLAGGIIVFRKTTAVKAARIWTMLIFLLGAGLLNTSTAMLIGELSSTMCFFRVALMIFGFVFFAGSLLVKQRIISNLMRVKYKLDKKDARRKTVLLRYQGLFLTAISGVLCLVWVLAAGDLVETSVVDASYGIEQQICAPNTALLMVYVFFGFIVLVVSCILAQQTKNFGGVIFGEAKFMFFSNYNAAIFFTFALALSVLDVPVASQGIFVSICVFVATIVTAVLIAGSRIYAGFYNFQAKSNTSSSKVTVAQSAMSDAPKSMAG